MPSPPTDLVYLSIGAISNHLHQFEYPSWILRSEKKRKDKHGSVWTEKALLIFFFSRKRHCPGWASCCAPCQMHVEQRKTRPWQHLAMAQRSFSALQPWRTGWNSLIIVNATGTCRVIWRKAIKSVWKIGFQKNDSVPKHSPAMKPSQCLLDF